MTSFRCTEPAHPVESSSNVAQPASTGAPNVHLGPTSPQRNSAAHACQVTIEYKRGELILERAKKEGLGRGPQAHILANQHHLVKHAQELERAELHVQVC